MPKGSEVAELQHRGLSFCGFTGAQSLRGGYYHGPSLDDDKAPATGHGLSLDGKAPVTTTAATSIAKLPTVAIVKHDLSFESHSIQDLDALADAEPLWDVRGEGAETRQRERGQRGQPDGDWLSGRRRSGTEVRMGNSVEVYEYYV